MACRPQRHAEKKKQINLNNLLLKHTILKTVISALTEATCTTRTSAVNANIRRPGGRAYLTLPSLAPQRHTAQPSRISLKIRNRSAKRIYRFHIARRAVLLPRCMQAACNKQRTLNWNGFVCAAHTTIDRFGFWLAFVIVARARTRKMHQHHFAHSFFATAAASTLAFGRMQIKTITKRWNRTTNNVIVYTRNFSFTLSLSLCLSMCLVVGTECLLPQQRRLCVCMKYVQRSFCGGYSGAVFE